MVWILSSVHSRQKQWKVYIMDKCQFKKTNINHYWLKYKTIHNNVVKEIRQSKQQYFDKLDQLLSSENIIPKLVWKTSKQLLNLNKSSGSIPT